MIIFYCVPNERDIEKKLVILFIIQIRKFWGGEEKTKNSFNLVRPDECFSP